MESYEESKLLAISHEKLYHYTNFEALKKILANRSLRATRLDKVDDKTENERIDDFWKNKLFVTCFTYDKNGEQRFGDEYAQGNQGVRIEFKTKTLCNLEVFLDEKCENKLDFIDRTDLNYKGIDSWGYRDVSLLDMEYVDDLYEGLVKDEDFTGLTYNDKTGYAKIKSYSWEKETRLRIALRSKGLENIYFEHQLKVVKPNFEYIFIKITDKMLENMEITLNPKADGELKN